MTNSPINHYIFIDFENTQDIKLSLLKDKPAKLLMLLGSKQNNLPVALVKQLIEYKEQVHLIEVNVGGKNALDFVLAYYLGQFVCQNPQNNYYILSKDKGYDALVNHLKVNKVKVQRYDDLIQIPLFGQQSIAATPENESSPFDRLTKLLKQSSRNRPAKRNSLITYTDSAFAKKLSTHEVTNLISQLQQKKVISFDEHNKVTYHL